jgi:hypothetical protein
MNLYISNIQIGMNTPGYEEAIKRIAAMGDDGILEFTGLKLSTLPPLPETVRELYCDKNKLTSLSDLPSHLIVLECNNNKLTSLPKMPESLDVLICRANKLTELPELPVSLKHLDCGENTLTTLPVLPNGLEELYFDYNRIPRIPRLPASLTHINADFNAFIEPFYLYYTRYRANKNLDDLKKKVNAYYDTLQISRNIGHTEQFLPKLAPTTTVYRLPQLPENTIAAIGSFLSGKPGTLTQQKSALNKNMKRGGSRKTRKAKKTRRIRH